MCLISLLRILERMAEIWSSVTREGPTMVSSGARGVGF